MTRLRIALAASLLWGCGSDQPSTKNPEPPKAATSSKPVEPPEITLDERTIQRIGVTTEQVRERKIPLPLRATANLQENELRAPDTSVLWMIIAPEKKDLARIRLGMPAEITFGDEPYPATVTRIEDSRVRLEVPNEGDKLKPGMEGEVELVIGESAQAIYLPEGAVQRLDGKAVVFVQKVPGTYEIRPATIGRKVEEYREITGGLKPGETVVVEGSSELKAAVRSRRRAE